MNGSQPTGTVAVLIEEGHVLVSLTGEVDLSLSEDLDQAVRDAVQAGAPIVVDVRPVTFMDSVGGSFLLRMASAVIDRGEKLTLRGPAGRVEELLVLMGAGELVSWEEAG